MDWKTILRWTMVLAATQLLIVGGAWAADEDGDKISLPSGNPIDMMFNGDPDSPVDCTAGTQILTVTDFGPPPVPLPGTTVSCTSSGGDSEPALMIPVLVAGLVWQGPIPVSTAPAAAANGILECNNGDVITCTYDNLQHGGPAGIDEVLTVGALPVELQSFEIE